MFVTVSHSRRPHVMAAHSLSTLAGCCKDIVQQEENDLDNFQPLQKRFKPPMSKEKLQELSKGYVPDNTKRRNTWALNIFLVTR